MKNIAILTGGDSAERVISLQSGQVIQDHLPTDRYNTFQIDIQGSDWREISSGAQINKNDFSLPLNGEIIHFDCAFAALHGSPLEDGRMQGYLDMIGLPYTSCDGYVSGLTMNKYHTKIYLEPLGIPMAKSVLVRRGEQVDQARILELGLPLFVKPNTHGSSFGITKVKTAAELLPAIEAVWPYDSEALVEAFMPGREFANGALRVNGEIIALPVTEIIPEREYFDYQAKYEGLSKEITPANLQADLEQQCRDRSAMLYDVLNCTGVVRFDYILMDNTFYLLEANSIPGFSPASLVPQQAEAHGWSLGAFFALLVEESMQK